jgi:hypothetical protein
VLGLEHDADPLGRELPVEPVRDLLRQALLHLEGASTVVDDAGELRQPDDPLGGQVADVGDADEGQQMVLAQRVERDPGGPRPARRSRRRSGTSSARTEPVSAARRTCRPCGAACRAGSRCLRRRRERPAGRAPRAARPRHRRPGAGRRRGGGWGERTRQALRPPRRRSYLRAAR